MDDPTNPFLLLIIIGVTLVSLALVYCPLVLGRWLFDRQNRKWLEEFTQAFPDRCPVCSFHWYGISHGYEDPGAPVPAHQCKERKA